MKHIAAKCTYNTKDNRKIIYSLVYKASHILEAIYRIVDKYLLSNYSKLS